MVTSKVSQSQNDLRDLAIQESFVSQITSLPIRFTVAGFFDLDRSFIASVSFGISISSSLWRNFELNFLIVGQHRYDDVSSGHDPVEHRSIWKRDKWYQSLKRERLCLYILIFSDYKVLMYENVTSRNKMHAIIAARTKQWTFMLIWDYREIWKNVISYANKSTFNTCTLSTVNDVG